MIQIKGQTLLSNKLPKINTPVVYCIENLITGSEYVGASIEFNKRMCRHRSELKHGLGGSKLMQMDCDQYGLSVFAVSVLEVTNTKDMNERECFHIKSRKPIYNTVVMSKAEMEPVRVSPNEHYRIIQAMLRKRLYGIREIISSSIGITTRTLTRATDTRSKYIDVYLLNAIQRELDNINSKQISA